MPALWPLTGQNVAARFGGEQSLFGLPAFV